MLSERARERERERERMFLNHVGRYGPEQEKLDFFNRIPSWPAVVMLMGRSKLFMW